MILSQKRILRRKVGLQFITIEVYTFTVFEVTAQIHLFSARISIRLRYNSIDLHYRINYRALDKTLLNIQIVKNKIKGMGLSSFQQFVFTMVLFYFTPLNISAVRPS
jgi:hypothetical protein